MSGSELIALLDKVDLFTNQDLSKVVDILKNDPLAASAVGSHERSTIWICAQRSNCPYRRKILPPLLVLHGADVNKKAENGNTPLHSLYTAWRRHKDHKDHHKQEMAVHKQEMAVVLTQVCHAIVPYDDKNGAPSGIQEWLNKPRLNFEVLE